MKDSLKEKTEKTSKKNEKKLINPLKKPKKKTIKQVKEHSLRLEKLSRGKKKTQTEENLEMQTSR